MRDPTIERIRGGDYEGGWLRHDHERRVAVEIEGVVIPQPHVHCFFCVIQSLTTGLPPNQSLGVFISHPSDAAIQVSVIPLRYGIVDTAGGTDRSDTAVTQN
jgi:hypothetical protein